MDTFNKHTTLKILECGFLLIVKMRKLMVILIPESHYRMNVCIRKFLLSYRIQEAVPNPLLHFS